MFRRACRIADKSLNENQISEVIIDEKRIPKTIYSGSMKDVESRNNRGNNAHEIIVKDLANSFSGSKAIFNDLFLKTKDKVIRQVANSLSNVKNKIDRLPEKIIYPIAEPLDKLYFQAQGDDEMAGWTHAEGLQNKGLPTMMATTGILTGGISLLAKGATVGGMAVVANSIDDFSAPMNVDGKTIVQSLTNDSKITNSFKLGFSLGSLRGNIYGIKNSAVDVFLIGVGAVSDVYSVITSPLWKNNSSQAQNK